MTCASTRPARRPGYTMIELMVVIAIIAVLVSLLLSGVNAVIRAKNRTETLHNIGKLDQSLSVALSKYGSAQAAPSRLLLFNNIDVYRDIDRAKPTLLGKLYGNTDVQDIRNTRAVLNKMFPRLLKSGRTVAWENRRNGATAVPSFPNRSYLLEGHYCLVFYLAGMIDTSTGVSTPIGFATKLPNAPNGKPWPSPVDPTYIPPAGTTQGDRVGPFYTFEAARLSSAAIFAQTQSNGRLSTLPLPTTFACYLDPYGALPFAYFGQASAANTYVGNSCPTLLGNNVPVYATTRGGSTAMNINTFQIISAGRDKKFGNPAVWGANAGTTDYNGRDDLSNFSQGSLGDGA